MEIVLFCGIQASGKTTFYLKTFFKSHVRISLDQLNTRNKEETLLTACLSVQQPVVIDNTNPTREERKRYIEMAKGKKYKVIGYYFQSKLSLARERNEKREGKEKIRDAGLLGTYKKLELPSIEEGFDKLFFVETENDEFIIKDWQNEV